MRCTHRQTNQPEEYRQEKYAKIRFSVLVLSRIELVQELVSNSSETSSTEQSRQKRESILIFVFCLEYVPFASKIRCRRELPSHRVKLRLVDSSLFNDCTYLTTL